MIDVDALTAALLAKYPKVKPETARSHAEQYAQTVAEKQVGYLYGQATGNCPVTCAAFARLTGTSAKTQRDRVEAVRQYVGLDVFDAWRQAKRQRFEQERAESRARYAQRRVDAEAQRQFRDGTAVADWLRDRIRTGYDQLVERRRGAVPSWVLANADGRGYVIRRRIRADLARQLLKTEARP